MLPHQTVMFLIILQIKNFVSPEAVTPICSLFSIDDSFKNLFYAQDLGLEEFQEGHSGGANITDSEVTIYTYNSKNKTTVLKNPSQLKKNCPVKLIIHGWKNNATMEWVKGMSSAYFQKYACVNVLAVDWRKPASKNYFAAVEAVQYVGVIVARRFLEMQKKVKFIGNIHAIGHSLGAHLAGFIGKNVKNVTTLKRISGLDVAAPDFQIPIQKTRACRLHKDDAKTVDVLHTTYGLGVTRPYGKADFYINGQFRQLNCSKYLPNIKENLKCSHQSVQRYFTWTILNPKIYPALECPTYAGYKLGECDTNKVVYMGDGMDLNAQGIFKIEIDKDGNVKKRPKQKQ